MALSANAVGCHGVDSSVDGGGRRFDFSMRLGVEKGEGGLEGVAEEVSERRDRGNRCGHSGKLCAPLLMRCFRNPRYPHRISRPVYIVFIAFTRCKEIAKCEGKRDIISNFSLNKILNDSLAFQVSQLRFL